MGVVALDKNQCILIYKPKIDLDVELPPICYRHRYGT
jgi:hypothetical protein